MDYFIAQTTAFSTGIPAWTQVALTLSWTLSIAIVYFCIVFFFFYDYHSQRFLDVWLTLAVRDTALRFSVVPDGLLAAPIARGVCLSSQVGQWLPVGRSRLLEWESKPDDEDWIPRHRLKGTIRHDTDTGPQTRQRCSRPHVSGARLCICAYILFFFHIRPLSTSFPFRVHPSRTRRRTTTLLWLRASCVPIHWHSSSPIDLPHPLVHWTMQSYQEPFCLEEPLRFIHLSLRPRHDLSIIARLTTLSLSSPLPPDLFGGCVEIFVALIVWVWLTCVALRSWPLQIA